ncbi:MAG: hypothetical protein NVSMB39_1680 [Candidatus Saccharimonadales bacterium]
MIKLELTTEDYRKLIELAYLGEWMINAQHDTEFQDEVAGTIIQKLLAAHRLHDVDIDDETGEYFMKSAWTERLYDEYILDYDDHTFWDELTERLAQRDLAKARGIEPDQLNRDDDLLALRPLEDKYRLELEEHGLDRLEIHPEF